MDWNSGMDYRMDPPRNIIHAMQLMPPPGYLPCYDPPEQFSELKTGNCIMIPNKCYINPTLLCDSQSCVRWCRG